MKGKFIFLGLLFWSLQVAYGQLTTDYSSGALLQRLEELNTLGSVLYIAAHPDDENTQLISYLANGRNFRTGYLSATRGDGGQNLIGPEIRERLGVLRTQELLAARRTDGGEQFFARANDFGYSKHPDETFSVWDKEKVLADFVWVIRNFQPDVLVTRFSRVPGSSHGHHTASAILAMEAFKLSGDSTAYPEQLEFVDTWQPSKIFYNIGLWSFRRSGKTFNEDEYLKIDVGGYNPHLGQSYTEISALSRSMHKSQGFGRAGSRGSEYEYFEQWGGDRSTEGLFEGIDTSWERVENSSEVATYLADALRSFDPSRPSAILGSLINARSSLLALPDQYWKDRKLNEIDELIKIVTGVFMEVSCDKKSYSVGDTIATDLEIINRSPEEIMLTSVNFNTYSENFIYNLDLKENQSNLFDYSFVIPSSVKTSNPYWLEKPSSTGMYTVDDQQQIGQGENAPQIMARVTLKIGKQFMDYELPVVYRVTDPVKGEMKSIVEITPRAIVNLDPRAMVFVGSSSKQIKVEVSSGSGAVDGVLRLKLGDGWQVEPSEMQVSIDRTGAKKSFDFKVTPPAKASSTIVQAELQIRDEYFRQGRVEMNYDHVPRQTIYPLSEVQVVSLPNKNIAGKIGYIMGAGDDVPHSLTQLGYEVELLDEDDIEAQQLSQFKAIILGVRAFNTLPWLAFKNQELFGYVKAGGNVIVQYNTSHRLVTKDVAPYDIQLSRDRVTVEEAPVTFLNAKHPVLQSPFKISAKDFDGWVQERGLYFPSEWAGEFTPILSMNDPGEPARKGSLLVAKHGKGYYCYTGLSFFRELPAGVSGAYKLLINMISLGEQ
ncbi:MAG: PIG-L family deacetylase [Cyclobacteriaceae bacterium]